MSDDLDFTIVASDDFGNFMWELPEGIKENFRLMIQKYGEDGRMIVSAIKDCQSRTIQCFLYILCMLMLSGYHAPLISDKIEKSLKKLLEESVELLKS